MRRFLLLALALAAGPAAPAATSDAPITPKETIVLFDGKTKKDLSMFYTWLRNHGRNDPDKVFTVVDQIDGAPAIRPLRDPLDCAPDLKHACLGLALVPALGCVIPD